MLRGRVACEVQMLCWPDPALAAGRVLARILIPGDVLSSPSLYHLFHLSELSSIFS